MVNLFTSSQNLAVCEIVVRAAKHLFKPYMQDVDQIYLSVAVSHFLNCFLTTNANLQPLKDVEDVRTMLEQNLRSHLILLYYIFFLSVPDNSKGSKDQE